MMMPMASYVSGFKSCTQGGFPAENHHKILMDDGSGDPVVVIHSENRLVSTQEAAQVNIRPMFDLTIQG